MPSRKILLLLFASLLIMAMLVEPSMGRELMKRKGKKKGGKKKRPSKSKKPSKSPSAPTGTGMSAATIQSKGYVVVGKGVYNINSFRHPGGSIINTCRGKDCTSTFNANHNSGAISKMSKYKVGTYGK